jgi:hypothetical protein
MSASDESASVEPAAVELVCVPPGEVARLWPHMSHYIARAMARGGMGRFADVEADVLGANAYLWLALRAGAILAAAVTQVTGEGAERLCTIVACGGHDWPRFGFLIEGLEDYARAEGCAAMEICGRPGWQRRLEGYRTVKAVIRKAL